MRERRWEELDMNCLAHIFARLGPEDKVLSIPFVCKSWFSALMDPFCWRSLDFSSIFQSSESIKTRFHSQYPGSKPSFSAILKLALHRSQGSTTELFLRQPRYDMHDRGVILMIRQGDLDLVEKECLGIKILSYDSLGSELDERIPKMVANLENLETLCLVGNQLFFEEILAVVNEHCARFACLMITERYFGELETKEIVPLPPWLKRLSLHRVIIGKKSLMSILDGCKELEELRILPCWDILPDGDVMRTFVYRSLTYGDEKYFWPIIFRMGTT